MSVVHQSQRESPSGPLSARFALRPGYLLIVVGALGIGALILAMGSPTNLECSRSVRGGPVDCTKQARLFGVISLGEQGMPGLRGAHVHEEHFEDYDGGGGGYSYRVELYTSEGMVPLRKTYTSDREPKDELAANVNEFIATDAPGTLRLVEPGLFSAGNLIMALLGLFCTGIWYVLALMFKTVKSVRARACFDHSSRQGLLWG